MKPIHPVIDTMVVMGSAISSAVALLLADMPVTTAAEGELRLFLLPLIGALLVSGGLIMLNPQPETRRIVIGRCIFSLFLGVCGPQVVGLIHPNVEQLVVKPFLLALVGGGIAFVAYVLSRPFCRRFYERADGIARREFNRVEGIYSPSAKNQQEDRDEAERK